VLDHLAGGYEKGESLESWFARTGPGEAPSNAEEHVGFLLHLEPIDAAPKTELSVLPAEGWFTGLENARRAERCPLGLAAVDVVRTSRGEAPGKWTFVRDGFELMPSLDRRIGITAFAHRFAKTWPVVDLTKTHRRKPTTTRATAFSRQRRSRAQSASQGIARSLWLIYSDGGALADEVSPSVRRRLSDRSALAPRNAR
jgi:hypothetical protein